MFDSKPTLESIRTFHKLCVDFATGKGTGYEDYENARNELLSHLSIRAVVPDWLIENRFGSQFWSFIKAKSPTYQGRRDFLDKCFKEILDYVENNGSHPVSISTQEMLDSLKAADLETIWRKINQRKDTDLDGAITAAKTMVETTLKYVLDQENETYTNKEDINELYKRVAALLNLSPAGHNEQLFKKILSGMTSIIQSFGETRNIYGDAHGKGRVSYKAEPRHAVLTINLAGTMSTFLLQTYLAHRKTLKRQIRA